MKENCLNHTIPNFLLKNFRISGTSSGIFYLDMVGTINQKNTKNRSELFNLKDFYSKKPLTELLKNKPHIEINPIFKKLDEPLEKNLDTFIEKPFSTIVNKIIETKNLNILASEDLCFIKEYLMIQFIRTSRYKEDVKYLGSKMEILSINEISRLIVQFARNNCNASSPRVNSQSREVRQEAQRIRLRLAYWKDPDFHSAEIIDKNKRDAFYQKTGLHEKNVSLLLNETQSPFILPDTGVTLIDDSGSIEILLPLNPLMCLKFSGDTEKITKIADETSINSINVLSLKDSFKAVFSDRKKYLEELWKSMSSVN